MGEDLGRAELAVGADLAPLDRDLAKAERRVAASVAAMQRMLDSLDTSIDLRVSAAEAAAERLAGASAVSSSPGTAERVIVERQPGLGPAAEVWGIRGPQHAGSITNPLVTVLAASKLFPMGSYAAAVGEDNASDVQRGDQSSGIASAADLAALTAAVSDLAQNVTPGAQLATAGGQGIAEPGGPERTVVALDAANSDALRRAADAIERASVSMSRSSTGSGSGAPAMDPAWLAALDRLRSAPSSSRTTDTTVIEGSRTTINESGGTTILGARGGGATHTGGPGPVVFGWPGQGGGGSGGRPPVVIAPGGGGDRGGSAGLLAGLGWGGGVAGLATAGSALSFAGLGFEHVITTILSVLGSATAALGGGGLLALGSLGKLAVGGGSDALVARSTIADTKTLGQAYQQIQTALQNTAPYQTAFAKEVKTVADPAVTKAYAALNDAIKQHGINSTQAATAQTNLSKAVKAAGNPQLSDAYSKLNTQLSGVSAATAALNSQMKALGNTAGARAELQLAKAGIALNDQWDKSTSQARVEVAGIGMDALKVAQVYLPLVAQAAATNFAIIGPALQPLFTWLKGPAGVGIFQQLEDEFATQLPTAIHALDQGVELFLRVVSIASQYTGGFVGTLDQLLTRWNSLSNSQIDRVIYKYVSDFRLWDTFVKLLISDVYLLFHQDAGTGNSIITALTGMLERLHAYETSAQGSAQIRNIFQIHKTEILGLLKLLPELASVFGHVYLAVAPGAVAVMNNVVLPVVNALATALEKLASLSPIVADALGALLIGVKFGGWKAVAGFVGSAAGSFKSLGAALGVVSAEAPAAAAGLVKVDTAAGAGVGIGAAGAGAGAAGASRLLTGSTTGTLSKAAGAVTEADVAEILGIGATASLGTKLAGLGTKAEALAAGLGRALPFVGGLGAILGIKDVIEGPGGVQNGLQDFAHGLTFGLIPAAQTLQQAMAGAAASAKEASPLPTLNRGLGAVPSPGLPAGVPRVSPLNLAITEIVNPKAVADYQNQIGVKFDLRTNRQLPGPLGTPGNTPADLKALAHAYVTVGQSLNQLTPKQVMALLHSTQQLAHDPSLHKYLAVIDALILKLKQTPQFHHEHFDQQVAQATGTIERRFAGMDQSLGSLSDDFDSNMRLIGTNSAAGQRAVRLNVMLMVGDLQQGMANGTISVTAGMAKLRQVLAEGIKTGAVTWQTGWHDMFSTLQHLYALGKISASRFYADMRQLAATGWANIDAETKAGLAKQDQALKTQLDNGQITFATYLAGLESAQQQADAHQITQAATFTDQSLAQLDLMHQKGKLKTSAYLRDVAGLTSQGWSNIKQLIGRSLSEQEQQLKAAQQAGLISHKTYLADVHALQLKANALEKADMSSFVGTMLAGMKGAGATTYSGMVAIVGELNKVLGPLGATLIPKPYLEAVKAGAPGGAVAPGLGVSGGAAGGAMWQIGRPGEAGRDSVPMNVGGYPIMVAPGERVAVLNRHQAPLVDQALQDRFGIPGLGGLFSQVRTPNYMASGGYVGPGGPVVLEPGVNMSVGQEPLILAALRRLAGELHEPVYVDSGYRSPAHSVAVGGFSNDPHTLGDAADIGAGNASKASMFGVAEALLHNVGLYRPFYPPDPNEVNHVQLLAGAVIGALKQITAPKVGGTGALSDLLRAAMGKATGAANTYLNKTLTSLTPTSGLMGPPVAAGAGGAGQSAWMQIARQIAGQHGWSDPELQAWLGVEQREDGSFSLTATNPGTGAYGLAQFINGPGEYAQYGGDSSTMVGQLTAMGNYIAQRYGDPLTAYAHELAYNWYTHGGMIPEFARGGAFRVMASAENAGERNWKGGITGQHGYSILSRSGGDTTVDPGQAFGLPIPNPPNPLLVRGRTGRIERVTLQDIGGGDSAHPTIGLYPGTRRDIGGGQYNDNWNGYVDIERADGKPFDVLRGSVISRFGPHAAKRRPHRHGDPGHGRRHHPRVSHLTGAGGRADLPTGGVGLPFGSPEHHELDRIFRQARHLNDILGPGSKDAHGVEYLNELLSYWPGIWGIQNPTAMGITTDPSQAIITTDPKTGQSVSPHVDTQNLALAKQFLEKQIIWQGGIVNDVESAVPVSSHLIRELHRAIHKRREEIKRKQHRIRENNRKIAAWKRRIAATQAKLRRYPNVGGVAHQAWHQDISEWTGKVRHLEDENRKLGGGPTGGSGGEIGRITRLVDGSQHDSLTSLLSKVANPGGGYSPDSLVGVTGLGGQLAQERTNLLTLEAELRALNPGAISKLLTTADLQGTPTPSAALTGTTAFSYQGQSFLGSLGGGVPGMASGGMVDMGAVLNAQTDRFAAMANLPDFAGIFHQGGTVPGPTGAERLALVQAGERITPIGGDGSGIDASLIADLTAAVRDNTMAHRANTSAVCDNTRGTQMSYSRGGGMASDRMSYLGVGS